MLDGTLLEKRGIPAAIIVTEPFIPTAHAMAEMAEMPDYAFAVVPHPIGSLDAAEVRARADAATPQVEALLLKRGDPR